MSRVETGEQIAAEITVSLVDRFGNTTATGTFAATLTLVMEHHGAPHYIAIWRVHVTDPTYRWGRTCFPARVRDEFAIPTHVARPAWAVGTPTISTAA